MNEPLNSYNLLSEYSCMLFPTFWQGEGFPGVIIDAYIAGLPVISSDWNMNSELIEDGETGFLVPVQNAKMLADKMLDLIKNPELVMNMRINTLAKAKDYHIDSVWPLFEKIIVN